MNSQSKRIGAVKGSVTERNRPMNYFDRTNVLPTSSNNHGGKSFSSSHELNLDEVNMEIPWSELVFQEEIGKGMC
jgi:hypothetical protein